MHTTYDTASTMLESGRKRLHVGIVGAGLMGQWHAAAADRAGATVKAILDTRLEAAEHLAAKYEATAIDSLDNMLTRADVDVLHLCTPLETHRHLTLAALQAGLHVLVEKPLAPTASATKEVLREAQRCGRLVCPVHQFAFQDGVRWACSAQARLGGLLGFEAIFNSAGAEGGQARDAVVADILPHPLSLMHKFLPGGSAVDGWEVIHSNPGEFRAVGTQQHIILSIHISMATRPTCAVFRLYGTGGTITGDLFHGFAYFEPGVVSRLHKIRAPFDRSFRNMTTAAVNMGRRLLRWEPAYPGLRPLVTQFYQAVQGQASLPFPPKEVLAIAQARDQLIDLAKLLH